MQNNCPLCGNSKYANLSQFAQAGHRTQCIKRQKKIELERMEQAMYDSINIEDFPSALDSVEYNDVINEFGSLCLDFLRKQNLRLSTWSIDSIEVGYCAMLNGERKKGSLNTYFKICQFVTHCHGLSAENASEMLQMWKKISHINGKEIPLPAKYSTMQERLLSSLDFLKISYLQVSIAMPSSLFTEELTLKMPKVVGLLANVLDITGNYVFYLYVNIIYKHVSNAILSNINNRSF